MGKRKPKSVSTPATYAMEFFVQVWTTLHKLQGSKTKYALNWVWQNEKVLRFVGKHVLHFTHCSRRLLYNGYHDCKVKAKHTFLDTTWADIDIVFGNKLSMTHMPRHVGTFIDMFSSMSQLELVGALQLQIERERHTTHLSWAESFVDLLPVDSRKGLDECFLGDWALHGRDALRDEIHPLCRMYPTDFVVLQKDKNITYIHDRSSGVPTVVAMCMRQDILSMAEKEFIRTMMIDLFAAHQGIERKSHMVLSSYMVGHGPFWNRWQRGGGNKLSFYTHPSRIKDLFLACTLEEQFGSLVDRYAHGTLVNIILALYFWWCPCLLESFFQYSQPHLSLTEYESLPLEKDLDIGGPCAYQMYVTEDYCSEVHVDDDKSAFTLCYASHPDGESTSPMDFVMADYGLRLPIGDGDLFAFRSNLRHGIGYRCPSANRVYVGCVAVNSRLHDLMQRRNS